jgi:hypothetical protein
MKVQRVLDLKPMVASKKRFEFAMSIANKGYDDLEAWNVYQVLPDAKAAEAGCIRVVDESGEDYLYHPADRFVALDLPKEVRARLPRWQPGNRPNRALQTTAK